MKRSKFTESQIVLAIKQVGTRTRFDKLCLTIEISEALYYNWKKYYGGLGLNKQTLKDVMKKEF